ncbi:MAG: hypothetical protein LBH79_03130 [Nitrososphaerota archaeon]|nr:hypothetical protein [Nitrososphaerota archaeon]
MSKPKNTIIPNIVDELLHERPYTFVELLKEMKKKTNSKFNPNTLNKILQEKYIKKGNLWSCEGAKYYEAEYEDRCLKHSKDLVHVLKFLREASLTQIAEQDFLLSQLYEEQTDNNDPETQETSDFGITKILDALKYNTIISYIPIDSRKKRIYDIDFSLDDYRAVKEHLESYPWLSKTLVEIMNNFLNYDKFLKERKKIIESEQFRHLSAKYYMSNRVSFYNKVTGEERCIEMSESEKNQFLELKTKCDLLAEKSLAYKIEMGAIKETMLQKFDYDIKKIIRSIEDVHMPLSGVCFSCPK